MYIDGYNHKEKYVFTENHLRNVRANWLKMFREQNIVFVLVKSCMYICTWKKQVQMVFSRYRRFHEKGTHS